MEQSPERTKTHGVLACRASWKWVQWRPENEATQQTDSAWDRERTGSAVCGFTHRQALTQIQVSTIVVKHWPYVIMHTESQGYVCQPYQLLWKHVQAYHQSLQWGSRIRSQALQNCPPENEGPRWVSPTTLWHKEKNIHAIYHTEMSTSKTLCSLSLQLRWTAFKKKKKSGQRNIVLILFLL